MDLRPPILDRRLFLKLSGVGACDSLLDRTLAKAMSDGTENHRPEVSDAITLFLCGDVMLGRGIDQILPHPGEPQLYEPAVTLATTYVELAERANGRIPSPVDFAYVWGDALEVLRRLEPDLRIINLETSITKSREAVPKGINYKMHPANAACLTSAAINCCALANNHVLDWGRSGLLETLETLEKLGGVRRRRPQRRKGRGPGDPPGPGQGPGSGVRLRLRKQRDPRRLGRRQGPRGRASAAGPLRTHRGAYRGADARAKGARRHPRRLDPLGRQLGLRGPGAAAAVRARADRPGRLRCRPWPFVAPSQGHRGPPRQADPLRLRRLPERL